MLLFFYALFCTIYVQIPVRYLVKNCPSFYPFVPPYNTWSLDANKLALKFQFSYLVLSVTEQDT